MEESDAVSEILEAERSVLRALCQGTLEPAVRAESLKMLANYSFRDTTHQLIFEIGRAHV